MHNMLSWLSFFTNKLRDAVYPSNFSLSLSSILSLVRLPLLFLNNQDNSFNLYLLLPKNTTFLVYSYSFSWNKPSLASLCHHLWVIFSISIITCNTTSLLVYDLTQARARYKLKGLRLQNEEEEVTSKLFRRE